MNWPGSPPRLDRVPAIWPPDVEKLSASGLETVDDLIVRVRQADGLTRLSERSGVPLDQLRSYFHVAQEESSKARARRRGAGVLVAVLAFTSAVAWVYRPELPTPEEEIYARDYGRYQEGDPTLEGHLDEIVRLYDLVRLEKLDAASSERARLDSLEALAGGEAFTDDGKMSPHLANLVSLRAAISHDAAVRAAEEGDLESYERHFQETRDLDALVVQAISHQEYWIENRQRALAERARVYASLQPSLIAESEDWLLKSRKDLLDSQTNLGSTVSDFLDSQTDLDSTVSGLTARFDEERQRAEVRSELTDSMQALTGQRLDGVDASVESIRRTLQHHGVLLDSLIALYGASRAPSEIAWSADAPGFETPGVESEPMFADDAAARRTIEAAWPRELRDARIGGAVSISVYVNREGQAQNPRVVTSSGHLQLDSAALSAVLEIEWMPAKLVGGDPVGLTVIKPIRFQPQG